MAGIGVVVNVLAILAGTFVGLVFGGLFAERFRSISFFAIGLATVVIGAAMSIGGLGDLAAGRLGDSSPLVLVGALVLGALLGEALGIEPGLQRFGERLQRLAHRMPLLAPGRAAQPGQKAHTLVEGFVTASLLYCVGAMAILGSIQDGLGDPSLLYLKALLDGVASIALASTLGAGVGLSVIPVAIFQGSIAVGAIGVQPFVSDAVIAAIQASGGALILAIGLDLMSVKRLPVGNMLPAIGFAAVAAAVWG